MADKHYVGIFETPIGVYQFNHEDARHLKDTCFRVIETSEGAERNNVGLVHYCDPSVGLNLLDCDGFDIFHEWIRASSLDYINNSLGYICEDVVVTECWLNVCKQGGFQPLHNHGNSFVSGTFFLNFTVGKHSPLTFFNVKNSIEPFMTLKSRERRDRAIVQHAEGTLLLWPSHTGHGYEKNLQEGRITISFNAMPMFVSTANNYGYKIVRT